MHKRNPFIPSERAREMQENTEAAQVYARKALSRQQAALKREAKPRAAGEEPAEPRRQGRPAEEGESE